MRIVLLNTYDQYGGASYACYRLFRGLSAIGVDVRMLVRESGVHPDEFVSVGKRLDGRLRALLDYLPLRRYPERQQHNFSPAWMPARAVAEAAKLRPDLLHLHWVPQGFVQIEALGGYGGKVLWTLHDSWAFTGGCHLPGDCRRYEQSCGACPVLGSGKENDWSRRIWQRKHNAWENLDLTIVTPSRWLAERAGASSLFANRRIEVIPNGIDTSRFCPGDATLARRALGLPEDRPILLFGAVHAFSDRNKGLDLLLQALSTLSNAERRGAVLVLFGEDPHGPLPDCGLPVINVGAISCEEKIACLYRSADLFILPSRQENLPNMLMEALACGTPAVAFAVGGNPELITHGRTGYLAKPYCCDDLGHGIAQILANESMRKTMAAAARSWATAAVGMETIVARYLALYQELAGSDQAR